MATCYISTHWIDISFVKEPSYYQQGDRKTLQLSWGFITSTFLQFALWNQVCVQTLNHIHKHQRKLITNYLSFKCHNSSPVPYFYPIYLFILLIWRERRDEARCAEKYKEIWAEYRKLVPWRILPYVY